MNEEYSISGIAFVDVNSPDIQIKYSSRLSRNKSKKNIKEAAQNIQHSKTQISLNQKYATNHKKSYKKKQYKNHLNSK